jgi:hypothetical protein
VYLGFGRRCLAALPASVNMCSFPDVAEEVFLMFLVVLTLLFRCIFRASCTRWLFIVATCNLQTALVKNHLHCLKLYFLKNASSHTCGHSSSALKVCLIILQFFKQVDITDTKPKFQLIYFLHCTYQL